MRLAPDLPARPRHDYVLIGRLEAIRLPFAALVDELARAFIGVHDAKPKRSVGERPARPHKLAESPRQVPKSP